MVEGTYDSDDDNRSPRLEPQRPNYQLDDEPPPFVSRRSSSNSDDAKKVDGKGTSLDRSRKHEPRKPETREGDSLLISYLDPTRSDLASFELRRSPHERLPLENDLSPGAGQKLIKPRKDLSDHTTTAGIASSALNLLGNEPLQHGLQDLKSLPPPPNKKGFNPDPPSSKHPGRLSISNHDPFGLPPFERTLPALQSPPESASAASPENLPKLPSIQSALSELSAVSPNDPAGRVKGTFPGGPGQFPTPQIPPSPYSHLSPASSKDMSNISSPVSQQSYWRPPLKSDIHYAASAHEPSPQAVKSPAAGYPTPTDQAGERPYNPGSQSNGTVPAGVYKCRHPGCDAPPFQTQYLLK